MVRGTAAEEISKNGEGCALLLSTITDGSIDDIISGGPIDDDIIAGSTDDGATGGRPLISDSVWTVTGDNTEPCTSEVAGVSSTLVETEGGKNKFKNVELGSD